MPTHVLIVDDERVNLLLTGKMVEKLGHTSQCAQNARQALEAMDAGRFDLALLDVQMPVVTGLDLARTIREREGGGPRVPIYALTAHADEEGLAACLEAGMDGLIAKPLEIDQLKELLERFSPGRD